MDLKDLQNLIKFVSKSEVAEIKYKTKDYEINIKNPGSNENITYVQQSLPQSPAVSPVASPVAPAAVSSSSASVAQEGKADDDSKYIAIKSPMIGTFYRKPSPDKDVFVNVGDSVSEGKVVCVIEAMKLFNQIESEVSGKIVKILVDDATPVEYDQPLFLVDPS
ncbi:acetyl-CoA carboxylase, biotin carboxyl carrier protein [Riemerella anatipestifer]|uniref:acetyl-CoA carboxylase biotin carboxyl carrier protein n=1 Tax=Riemerella anatipestifer TaxID=34085 RepID=UPI0007EDA6E3|nr:acetyl-CoA carboxylase biotin carboxyl carrier protein [Riemerella anatipestifer]MDY3502102.1 acetyl-CoA carboxylase biotin carboxyl carrier protein [Riemerella anatipestifer]OBP43575.1 acetyl-CoA carboxylase, biotin carboxyl carrier protein [Riemerella anatipestifer]OBP47299.1 acetyl-CoA carboxylase, biotin carboxyl carrier protein [Riemerella anatipestifer]